MTNVSRAPIRSNRSNIVFPKEIIKRRQELPKTYYRDGAIYITKTEVLLEQHSLYGNTISYIEADAERHVNIDTREDWQNAEKLAKKLGL